MQNTSPLFVESTHTVTSKIDRILKQIKIALSLDNESSVKNLIKEVEKYLVFFEPSSYLSSEGVLESIVHAWNSHDLTRMIELIDQISLDNSVIFVSEIDLSIGNSIIQIREEAKKHFEYNYETIEIPDIHFQNSLKKEGINVHKGKISKLEAILKDKLHLSDVENFEGIEHFTTLRLLTIHSDNVQKVDLSKNIYLRFLNADFCTNLCRIQIEQNHLLKSIRVQDTKIDELDLEECPLLEVLLANACHELVKLNLKQNLFLRNLGLNECPVGELDLTNNRLLRVLDFSSNSLIKLDVRYNTLLVHLVVNGIYLKDIDISKNVNLKYFSIFYKEDEIPSNHPLKILENKYNDLDAWTKWA